MNKNRNTYAIFIALLFIIINIIFYEFYAVPLLDQLSLKKSQYSTKNDKLLEMLTHKNSIANLQKDINELEIKAKDFSILVPNSIDTPQLVYDFYNSCNKYKLKPETIVFDLSEQDKKENDSQNSNTKEPRLVNYYILEITLKVSGNKSDLINYIYNINSITQRKLNIKSLLLNENTTVSNTKQVIQNSGAFSAEITFCQYVNLDENQIDRLKNYSFYNNEVGFNSIAEMFK